MDRKQILSREVKHFDVKSIDATQIINAMRAMSFTSRDTASAADIYDKMLNDLTALFF